MAQAEESLFTLVHKPLERGVLVALGVIEAILLGLLVRHIAARRQPARNEYLYSGAGRAPVRPWEA